jgi:hypothetical protein
VGDKAEAWQVRSAMSEAECIWAFDGDIFRADCSAGRCKAVYDALEPACGQEDHDAGTGDAGG